MNVIQKKLFLIIVAGTLSFPAAMFASTTQGTVGSNSYAWGDNLGWINLGPTDASGTYNGIVITDSAVTGYAWSSQFGWINFAPSTSGVTNDGSGNLGGYAWSSDKGWINMSGVTISGSSGIFSGIAGSSSTSAGRINFSCASCSVVTDWRSAAVRNASSGGSSNGGGGGGGYWATTSTPATQTGTTATSLDITSTGYLDWFNNKVHRADIMQDGVIDLVDFNTLMVHWGMTDKNDIADVNGDGVVDLLDFNYLMVYWGEKYSM